MKNKINLVLGTLFLAALVLTIASVSAAVVNPANSATISGTAVLNATNATLPDMVNCTFYAMSASTGNSSWTSLGTFTNATANPLNINGTFVSTILEDSSDYQFNATCRNSSNSMTSSVGTATVTIDNTVPTAPSALSPATLTLVTDDGTQTFSSTVVDGATTGCTYVIARGGTTSGADYVTGTATYSAGTCSFTKAFTDTNDNGAWNWYIIASDGTNTTSSGTAELQVQLPPSGGHNPDNDVPTTTSGNNPLTVTSTTGSSSSGMMNNPIVWIVGIIVVLIVTVVLVRRKHN